MLTLRFLQVSLSIHVLPHIHIVKQVNNLLKQMYIQQIWWRGLTAIGICWWNVHAIVTLKFYSNWWLLKQLILLNVSQDLLALISHEKTLDTAITDATTIWESNSLVIMGLSHVPNTTFDKVKYSFVKRKIQCHFIFNKCRCNIKGK